METLLIIFLSGLVGGYMCFKLKLPLLVGYIAAGIAIGNIAPELFKTSVIDSIADVAVTLLLFSVGLEFSLHRLSRIMGSVFWHACVQICITGIIFYVIFSFLSFPFIPSVYVAIALSFSSTAIVVKYLTERGEMDTVPGEIATAWLAVQDLSVILFVILLSFISGSTGGMTNSVLWSLIVSVCVISLILFTGRHIVPRVFDRAALLGNRELFLLCIIGVLLAFSALFAYFGLSAPLGAFLAGLLIAETTQHHAIFAEIRPLRDVFSVLFFVSIGISFRIIDAISMWQLLLGITVIIVLVRWFVTWAIGVLGGFHKKTAFFVSCALIPVSEFAVILMRMGIEHGVLSDSYMTLTVGLVCTTVFIGMPVLTHMARLYYWFGGSSHMYFPSEKQISMKNHIVICGYGRVGKYIGRALDMAGVPYLVVDYNQSVIHTLRNNGVSVVYGDPADPNVLDYAQVDVAKVLVIAIPDKHTQELIITSAKKLNKKIKIICRTHHEEDQKRLKNLGVTTIIQPEFEAALSITGRLLSDFGKTDEDIAGKISRLKIEHGLG